MLFSQADDLTIKFTSQSVAVHYKKERLISGDLFKKIRPSESKVEIEHDEENADKCAAVCS